MKTYFDHAGDAYGVLRDFGRGRLPSRAQERRADRRAGRAHRPDPVRRHSRRAQRVDLRPRAQPRPARGLATHAGEVVVSTSCSLLHTPIDLDSEPGLDDELRSWMAFAKQKAARSSRSAAAWPTARRSRVSLTRTAARSRIAATRTGPATRSCGSASRRCPTRTRRESSFEVRREAQRERLDLPLFRPRRSAPIPRPPRSARRGPLRAGEIDCAGYEQRMKAEIERVISFQEEVGLDVLVHGEPERNDMVQYFAEQMVATRSRRTRGFSPTARATCGRRSCTGT